jgi:hypothetical protein
MAFGISGDGTSPAEECDSGMDIGSTTAAQGFGTPISMDAAVSQRRCCFNISLQDGMSNRFENNGGVLHSKQERRQETRQMEGCRMSARSGEANVSSIEPLGEMLSIPYPQISDLGS